MTSAGRNCRDDNIMDFPTSAPRPCYDVLEQMARRARASCSRRAKVIDASMSSWERGEADYMPLDQLYKLHGWTGDPEEHAPALQRDGWARVTRNGRWYWMLSYAVRVPWISPRYLFDRCRECIASDNYKCDHAALSIQRYAKTLYVLDLADDNTYVGISNQPLARFEQHMTRTEGVDWTREHLPLRIRKARVVSLFEWATDEDEETLWQMRLHGIDRVQGGQFIGEDGARLARARFAREGWPPRIDKAKPAPASPIHLTFRELRQAAGACA